VLDKVMSLKPTILRAEPTSYWPLDDALGSSRIHDECGLHSGEPFGVDLGDVPFGSARMPRFGGRLGQFITIPNDERYSHAYANALIPDAGRIDRQNRLLWGDRPCGFVEPAVEA
jgi:hypothetical protein